MTSVLFADDRYGQAIKAVLEERAEELAYSLRLSPRAAGDAIQKLLSVECETVLGDACTEYSSDFARRAMADWAFTDTDGCYYVVDVKTHRLDTAFNMPNLVSVERLSRFYEDDRNHFVVLLVKYRDVSIEDVLFAPIEHLSWECLTIGALGWGQIQIANASHIIVDPSRTRRDWMLRLCDAMLAFYPREIEKINDRLSYFGKVRQSWTERE